MDTSYSHALQAEGKDTAQPGLLLRSVHSLYFDQFRRWFGIMAPTSLLSGATLMLANQKIKAINASLHRGDILHQFDWIAVMGAVRYGSFFLSWLLGCFALAAIATAVNEFGRDVEAAAWRYDAYERAREHFGALISLTFITFVAFFFGMMAFGFVELTAYRIVHWPHFSKYNYPIVLVGTVIVASVVSWLSVAIPLSIKGDVRVKAALMKSVELSNGYEGALFLLVVESVAGSMLVWYAVVHGLPLFLPRDLLFTAWYSYLLNAAGVLAGAAIDAPLFLGLSLLADPERFNGSLLRREAAT